MFGASDEDEEVAGPTGTFGSYLAEGDRLYLCGNFKKALTMYDLALEVKAGELSGLVARSRCHLQLGDSQAALKDAETSLEDNPKYHRGIYAKAEALYQMGDFEFALVFYHRGEVLRPELQEFRLGIQKCQEAIDNCVGSPSSIKLQAEGDLSFFHEMDEGKGKSAARARGGKASVGSRAQSKTHKSGKRASKVMLGELSADKEYLEKLLKDDDLVKGSSASGVNIYDLVLSGIQYLDTRSEFWRQQKPLYARKRDKLMMQRKWSSSPVKGPEPAAFILINLEKIDALLAEGKARDSLQLATSTFETVENMQGGLLPNKDDVLANLHSCIGNAYLELGNLEMALHHHQEDFEISKDLQFLDAKSRALDNLGRVHARAGKFQKAIICWEEKLHLSRSSLESTWLYHEIGRCYLELGDCEKAVHNGITSLEEATKANDEVWQLNASVLIAQAQVKEEDYAKAIVSFKKASVLAKRLNDQAAQDAVAKALEDVNIKRSKQFHKQDAAEEAEKGPIAEHVSDVADEGDEA